MVLVHPTITNAGTIRLGNVPGNPFDGIPPWVQFGVTPGGAALAPEFWFVRPNGSTYDDVTTSARYAPGETVYVLIRTGVSAANAPQLFSVAANRAAMSSDHIFVYDPANRGPTQQRIVLTDNMYQPAGSRPRASGWIVVEFRAPAWVGTGTARLEVEPHVEAL